MTDSIEPNANASVPALPPAAENRTAAATATASSRPSLLGLVLLMLAAALAFLAVAIWRLHERTEQLQRNTAVMQEALNQARGELSNSIHQYGQQISTLREKLAQQQGSHDDLRAIVAGGAESFAEAQRRHAADYFVQQAAQRLNLNQDVKGAIAALDAAAQELVSSKLAANLDLRKKIQADRQTLSALPAVDVLAIGSKLVHLSDIVNGLAPLGPALDSERYSLIKPNAQPGWLGSFQNTLQQFSGDWFLVRQHDQEVSSPPDAIEGRRIKLALALAIAEARLAAYAHDSVSYQNAPARALRPLDQYYANADGSAPLREGLLWLQQQPVAIITGWSLSALSENGASGVTP